MRGMDTTMKRVKRPLVCNTGMKVQRMYASMQSGRAEGHSTVYTITSTFLELY
jgi:hypothetical protein